MLIDRIRRQMINEEALNCSALLCCVGMLALMPVSAAAQDTQQQSGQPFALFENIETQNNSARAAENARNSANARATRNTQAAPVFTLVGTSRIGSRQTALLKHMNGETVRVELAETSNPVPGHELYSVLGYGAEQIAIRYPSAMPCRDFPDQGVSCDSNTNISTLSLTTAEPLVVQAVPEQTEILEAEVDEEAEEQEQAEEAVRRNPFAALRDRNRAANAAGSTQASPTSGFQPRRINPAEVPPGYRVISTPFGDRMVEQQQ